MAMGIVESNGNVVPVRSYRTDIAPASQQLYISCASYKERVNNSNEASRNRRAVFLKGIGERVRWETNSSTGSPMIVRRMVVSGNARIDLAVGVSGPETQPTHVVSNGNHFIGVGIGPMNVTVAELLFAGTYAKDWTDDTSARIDSRRWKIHSDKTFVVRSGNQNEAIMQRRFYDGINRTMTYDDEENGTDFTTSGWAAWSSQGHQQNVYIIYQVYNPGTSVIQPSITTERTLYWHER